jgi:hypothetical protein
MSQLSPLAQFVINEMRDCYPELPDAIHIEGLAHVFLKNDDTPPHVVALIKELQAHLT